MITSSLSVA